MSPKFKLVKHYYDNGIWGKGAVKKAVEKGWITAEEYFLITGEEYSAPAQPQAPEQPEPEQEQGETAPEQTEAAPDQGEIEAESAPDGEGEAEQGENGGEPAPESGN